jgi:inhibitor of cysteine peptidase
MADIALGPDDDGTTVSASVGDRIVVTLPENATTGFRWEVESLDSATLELEASDAVPPHDLQPGQTGARRVVLRVIGEGRAQVRLQLRRSWEPPEHAAEHYAVTVRMAQP